MYVLYGMDSGSIEDPDQMVLVRLEGGQDCEDADALEDFIERNWNTTKCATQPVVGLDDVLDSMCLALTAAGVENSVIDEARNTIIDAVGNNLYA